MEQRQRSRVAVVDDDFDVRSMLAMVLEIEGYEVMQASNGQEALDRLRSGPLPCVILLDLRMPGMSGWQFREAQRSDPALLQIPVVVLSGDEGIAADTAGLGAARWLHKPVDIDDLLAAVRAYG